MKKLLYHDEILRIIQTAKSVPYWAISDYLDPIRKIYSKLSIQEKKKFRLSIFAMLQEKYYLHEIANICVEMQLKDACPLLINLFLNPPKDLKENGHPIWIEGLRNTLIASLGKLGCEKSIPLLKSLLEEHISQRRSTLPLLSGDNSGVIILAFTKISPFDAVKYFGWWIKNDRQLHQGTMAMVKGAKDWKKMEELNIGINIDECESHFMQGCLIAVAKKCQLSGLKKWLQSIVLLEEKDRNYLWYQLECILTKNDPLADLKVVLKYKGDTQSLAKKLSLLPALRKKDNP